MPLLKISTPLFYALITGALGTGIALFLKKYFRKRDYSPIECIFFSPRDIHYSRNNFPCSNLACPLCSYTKLCTLLRTTRSELDVCMYLITETELANIIVKLFRKGVKVRLITDKQMCEDAFKSKNGLFTRFKIPLKYIETKGMMHNKFIIIDRKIVISGSCNWTQNGFMSNYENMLIIRSDEIARNFTRYFNSLWTCERDA